jgi:hypothetical protein
MPSLWLLNEAKTFILINGQGLKRGIFFHKKTKLWTSEITGKIIGGRMIDQL